jgi:hypothetical protein
MRSFPRLALLFLVAGCYGPDLGAPGYYCHPTDNPACPSGQVCVAGRCVTPGMAPLTVPDLALARMPDLVSSSPPPDLGGPPDLTPPPDLTVPPVDLSTPPADLTPPACMPSGASCTSATRKQCCSSYCDYTTHSCCDPSIDFCN